MKNLTIRQAVDYIVKNGYQKIRQLRLDTGEFRYNLKDITEAEWALFDLGGENIHEATAERIVEKGGWMLLDNYTATLVQRVMMMYSEHNDATKFNRLPLNNILDFCYAVVK